MVILVTGNPLCGFNFVGPFETSEQAIEYGESVQDDWWLAFVEKPN